MQHKSLIADFILGGSAPVVAEVPPPVSQAEPNALVVNEGAAAAFATRGSSMSSINAFCATARLTLSGTSRERVAVPTYEAARRPRDERLDAKAVVASPAAVGIRRITALRRAGAAV